MFSNHYGEEAFALFLMYFLKDSENIPIAITVMRALILRETLCSLTKDAIF